MALLMKFTIVETPEFIKRAQEVLEEDEKQELIEYLSDYPEVGDLIPGTGGARKLRWIRKGMGKRGGSRVIYFYYNELMPLFLLTVFQKNQKVDLEENEKKALKILLKTLVEDYEVGEKK